MNHCLSPEKDWGVRVRPSPKRTRITPAPGLNLPAYGVLGGVQATPRAYPTPTSPRPYTRSRGPSSGRTGAEHTYGAYPKQVKTYDTSCKNASS